MNGVVGVGRSAPKAGALWAYFVCFGELRAGQLQRILVVTDGKDSVGIENLDPE